MLRLPQSLLSLHAGIIHCQPCEVSVCSLAGDAPPRIYVSCRQGEPIPLLVRLETIVHIEKKEEKIEKNNVVANRKT